MAFINKYKFKVWQISKYATHTGIQFESYAYHFGIYGQRLKWLN